ncbi:hypothetical protein [Stakelama tenebrarum]|uniref:Uncharacterized protein n=1 Tax=Stakelama tenebrarum TaxID=2711215 RepID=A0A6G6Y6D4_9SPHN|nr:hypothetical protein [Sphingosinithalassobacter tenebrarum]QIG80278.1 hypothetical protein G5C33_11155 [Sphingosinithalassobacter tenebrarum]
MRVIAVALLIAGISATPAAAQYYGGGTAPSARSNPIWSKPAAEMPPPAYQPGVGRDLVEIENDIRDGRAAGQLTRREARALRRQGYGIARLEGRLRHAGLTASERAELETRAALLRDDVIAARTGSRD